MELEGSPLNIGTSLLGCMVVMTLSYEFIVLGGDANACLVGMNLFWFQMLISDSTPGRPCSTSLVLLPRTLRTTTITMATMSGMIDSPTHRPTSIPVDSEKNVAPAGGGYETQNTK